MKRERKVWDGGREAEGRRVQKGSYLHSSSVGWGHILHDSQLSESCFEPTQSLSHHLHCIVRLTNAGLVR